MTFCKRPPDPTTLCCRCSTCFQLWGFRVINSRVNTNNLRKWVCADRQWCTWHSWLRATGKLFSKTLWKLCFVAVGNTVCMQHRLSKTFSLSQCCCCWHDAIQAGYNKSFMKSKNSSYCDIFELTLMPTIRTTYATQFAENTVGNGASCLWMISCISRAPYRGKYTSTGLSNPSFCSSQLTSTRINLVLSSCEMHVAEVETQHQRGEKQHATSETCSVILHKLPIKTLHKLSLIGTSFLQSACWGDGKLHT